MAIFSKLGNYRNIGLLVMRAGIGAMMCMHGLGKLTGGPGAWRGLGMAMDNLHIHFGYVFWGFMCAVTEAIGGLFCVLGLWFRMVCLFMIVNFIVAIAHQVMGGEGIMKASEAIVLAFTFFGLLFIGPGSYSVDKG